MIRPAQRLGEIIRAFLKLGCISFGGPVAHLGYFQNEFVKRRRWLDDAAFADTVALCQFLPGPASSQVVFALGAQRAGWLGGLLASLCFTLPSAALMILFGYSVASFGDLRHAGWLHGLKLAAVAVVAQAVWSMGRKLCPDRTRLTIAVAAAVLLLCVPMRSSKSASSLAADWPAGGFIGGTLLQLKILSGRIANIISSPARFWRCSFCS